MTRAVIGEHNVLEGTNRKHPTTSYDVVTNYDIIFVLENVQLLLDSFLLFIAIGFKLSPKMAKTVQLLQLCLYFDRLFNSCGTTNVTKTKREPFLFSEILPKLDHISILSKHYYHTVTRTTLSNKTIVAQQFDQIRIGPKEFLKKTIEFSLKAVIY